MSKVELSGMFAGAFPLRLRADNTRKFHVEFSGTVKISDSLYSTTTELPLVLTQAGHWKVHRDFQFVSVNDQFSSSIPGGHDIQPILAEMLYEGYVDAITLYFEDPIALHNVRKYTDTPFGWSFWTTKKLMSVFGVSRQDIPCIQSNHDTVTVRIPIHLVHRRSGCSSMLDGY
jgi:hypothetical protein